jgi:transmembrane sensor
MDASELNRQASEEAADWWVRLQLEAESQSTREQYIEWLRVSPAHIAEMLRMGKVHGLLAKYPRWRDGTDAHISEVVSNVVSLSGTPKELSFNGRHIRTRRHLMVGLAAFLATVVVSSTLLWAPWRGQVIDTQRAERREVVLDDGTVMQLDPKTRVRVKFGTNSRTVSLERGRAVFRVFKDPKRSFLVDADNTLIRAIGTAFGVDRRRQDVIVTVMEGKVAVSSESSAPASREGRPAKNEKEAGASEALYLTANQQVMVATSGRAQPVRQVNSGRELAWAQGRLVFENDTVAEVIEKFNRYNRLQLHVTDSALAARPVSGVFNASAPDSFIRFLRTVADVKVARDGEGDITLASAP